MQTQIGPSLHWKQRWFVMYASVLRMIQAGSRDLVRMSSRDVGIIIFRVHLHSLQLGGSAMQIGERGYRTQAIVEPRLPRSPVPLAPNGYIYIATIQDRHATRSGTQSTLTRSDAVCGLMCKSVVCEQTNFFLLILTHLSIKRSLIHLLRML